MAEVELSKEQELAQAILKGVNPMNFNNQEFVDELLKGHRTLQQSVARLFLNSFAEWADVDFYDARNEATVKVAKIIQKATEDEHLPFI